MTSVPETRALVKNTFLEFVEAPEEEEEGQPRILTAHTDSRALGIWNCRDAALSVEDGIQVESAHPGPSAEATAPETPTGAGSKAPRADGDPAPTEQRALKTRPELDVDYQVLVKNTFLELVEEGEEDEPQGKIMKSSTDTAAMLRCDPAELLEAFKLRPLSSPAAVATPEAPAGTPEPQAACKEAQEAAMPPIFEEQSVQKEASMSDRAASKPSAGAAEASAQASSSSSRGAYSTRRDAAADYRPNTASADGSGAMTTLMLRNVPNDYTREMVLELLDALGFAGRYDFIYYPSDFTRNAGLGYAFVNMLTPNDAKQVRWVLEGFRQWSVPSSKVCSVGWSVPCQGLESNIERYRNSPVMHKSVPDEFKPAVFRDGQRVPFPKPTRKVRRPDSRKGGC